MLNFFLKIFYYILLNVQKSTNTNIFINNNFFIIEMKMLSVEIVFLKILKSSGNTLLIS